jgi:hypothetical protein
MRFHALAAALLLFTTAATSFGQEQRKPITLPEGVAGIVHGEFIQMAEFQEVLVRRYVGTEDGKKALETLAEEELIRREKELRGIRITDLEIERYIAKVERDVVKATAGTRTLDQVLAEKDSTRAQLAEVARDYLARQKMAAADTGIQGEVSTQAMGVWLEDLKKKRGMVLEGPEVPAGALARVGDRIITKEDLGARLIEYLGAAKLESALWDLAISRAVQLQLKASGISIESADIDQALEDLREEFKADPRFKNTTFTFDQYVEAARNLSLEELRQDPLFLAQVGLAKTVRAGLTGEEVRKHWEENRDLYGESRTFIHLLIRADDRQSTPFGGQTRSYRKAREIIDVIHARYLRGTPFEKLVGEASEDRDKFTRPDRPISVTRASPMPESWKKAVFSAPIGDVIGPIRSPYGYHLVKLLEVEPAPSFEAARAKVLRDLVRDGRTKALLMIRQDPQIILRY